MAFQISPGVELLEQDRSLIVSASASSIAAYGGRFRWGPAGVITTVSSELDLGQRFGVPSTQGEASRSFLTAASFLKYGNNLKVNRAVASDSVNASAADISSAAVAGSPLLKNQTDFDSSTDLGIFAKYPGDIGNTLKVLIVTSSNYDDFSASDAGFSAVQYEPSTTLWAEELTGSSTVGDEIHIIVVDSNGEFSGTPGSVLETFIGVSLAENAKTETGASNYYKNVLATSSAYINARGLEVELLEGVTGSVTLTATSADLTPTTDTWDDDEDGGTTPEVDVATSKYVVSLVGGDDGSVAAGDIVDSLEIFEDPEFVDISFIFSESLDNDSANQATIDTELVRIVKSRKDAIAFISAPLEIYALTTASDKSATVVTKSKAIESCSYVVMDSSPGQTYNKYLDVNEWIPLAGHLAGLCAYTDQVADAWFSPAGLNRGQLRGIIQLAFNPNKTYRDELYKASVNPVVSFPGEGILLYGDKTKLSRPSAFGRINVRRLFILLEKSIANMARYQLFEFNDEFTRSVFKGAVEPFLRTVKGRRGIVDFVVKCDSDNNTDEVIDSNGFVAEIFVDPARSINNARLTFVATRSGGIQFTETSE